MKREIKLNKLLNVFYSNINITYKDLVIRSVPYYFSTQHELISSISEIHNDKYIEITATNKQDWLYIITPKGKTFKRKGGYVWEKIYDRMDKWKWVIIGGFSVIGWLLYFFK